MRPFTFIIGVLLLFLAAGRAAAQETDPPTPEETPSIPSPVDQESGVAGIDRETGFELPGRIPVSGDGPGPMSGDGPHPLETDGGPHPLLIDIRGGTDGPKPLVEVTVSKAGQGGDGPIPFVVVRIHGDVVEVKSAPGKRVADSSEYRGTGRVYRKKLFGRTALALEFAPGIRTYVDYNRVQVLPMPVPNLEGKSLVIRGRVETRQIPGEGQHAVIVATTITGTDQ